MVEMYIPAVGVAWFGGTFSDEELEQALTTLCNLSPAERAQYFAPFEIEDSTLGISVSGLQCIQAPLSGVELARLLAIEARAFKSSVELRVRWARMHGAPFLATPNVETVPGVCLSCGDALPPVIYWGRCRACATAFNLLAMDADTELPERQRQ